MNKKFSTLMALALLTGSVTAQTTWQEAYRTFETKSIANMDFDGNANKALDNTTGAALSTGAAWSKDVKQVQEGLWYQLEIKNDDTSWADVLIQERDYQTGKVYLRSVAKEKAPLNASLWQLKYGVEDEATGGHWTLVNKETGLELTFDHSVIENDSVSEMRDGVKVWAWYDFNRTDKKDYTKVYASLHNQAEEEVMYLAYEEDGDKSEYNTVGNLRAKLNTDGFKFGTGIAGSDKDGGKLVKAVVEKMSVSDIDGVANALAIKPVLATPFFMTAAQFNTRMDADDKDNKENFQFVLNKEVIGAESFVDQKFSAVENMFGWGEQQNFNQWNTLNVSGTSFDSKTDKAFWPIYDGFELSFKAEGTETYLLADTARYQENLAPSKSPAIKFALKKPADTDNDYMKARYMFRATYFPTNDSIVIEPLNAAVQADFEWNAKTSWANSAATKSFVRSQYSKANTFVNDYSYEGSRTVSLTTTQINGLGEVLTAAKDDKDEFRIKTTIDRPFEYLKRTTKPSGLYYIKVAEGENAGRNIVHNMGTHIMYDTQARNQDYSLMPSTMWVVEQLGCEKEETAKYVRITNREYCDLVFEGQLYETTDAEGNVVYRFIDRSTQYFNNGFDSNSGWFNKNSLNVRDILTIEPVTAEIAKSEHHGYKWLDKDVLEDGVENNYQIKLNSGTGELTLKHVDGKNIEVAEGEGTIFEIAEATWNTDKGAIENEFGYGSESAGVGTLTRKAYVLKVKDENLIDNDRLYLARVKDEDGRYYYKAIKKSELNNNDKKLAVLYLKADQLHYEGESVADTSYVFVDVQAPNVEELSLTNGWNKIAVEDGSNMMMLRDASLEDRANDVADAFYFQGNKVNQYINISTDYNIGLNGNIKIYNKLAEKNYLFEDCNDANNVGLLQKIDPEFHYLGTESKGLDKVDKAAFYVDEVVMDNTNMQRYLLGVRVDSIADGKICASKTHGYWTADEYTDQDETHVADYNGYTAGWFLVNLEDSVANKKYTFNDYTRLGFVQGIHMVKGEKEYLYILKPGVVLDDLMTIKDNSAVSQTKYTKAGYVLDPDLLTAENVDTKEIGGNINTNHTFSLRRISSDNIGTAEESEAFLLESACENIGAFTGAWVKTENGVPVLAKINTGTEDHEAGSSTIAERIGQSGVFYFGATTDEATANEEIATSSVVVAGVNGAVVVKGAEGKNVIVSTILGKVVANEVVSSDNATIAAPAGVVVVSVDGESFKVVVK